MKLNQMSWQLSAQGTLFKIKIERSLFKANARSSYFCLILFLAEWIEWTYTTFP